MIEKVCVCEKERSSEREMNQKTKILRKRAEEQQGVNDIHILCIELHFQRTTLIGSTKISTSKMQRNAENACVNAP